MTMRRWKSVAASFMSLRSVAVGDRLERAGLRRHLGAGVAHRRGRQRRVFAAARQQIEGGELHGEVLSMPSLLAASVDARGAGDLRPFGLQHADGAVLGVDLAD